MEVVGEAAESGLVSLSPWLSRGRFNLSSVKEGWRRLSVGDDVVSGSGKSSGTMTADATAL